MLCNNSVLCADADVRFASALLLLLACLLLFVSTPRLRIRAAAFRIRTYVYHRYIVFISADYIAQTYASMRAQERDGADGGRTYTTPRTLLSILRLAMAVAKLRFDSTVLQVRFCIAAAACWRRRRCTRWGCCRRIVGAAAACRCSTHRLLSFLPHARQRRPAHGTLSRC